MSQDEKYVREAVKEQRCQGACEEHRGEVRQVTVSGWGLFAYCDAAVEEDQSRGLTVEQPPGPIAGRL